MAKKSIGEFLSTLRKANGYTQQEVADKLGVSNRTLSSWETDRTVPDILILPAIADLYGVTADEILRGERLESIPTPALSESKKLITKFNDKLHLYGGFAIVGAVVAAVAMMIVATKEFPVWLNIVLCVGGYICMGVFTVLAFCELNFATNGLVAVSSETDEVDKQSKLLMRRKAGTLLQLLSLPFLACAFAVMLEYVIAPPSYFYYGSDAAEKCYIIGFTLDFTFGILLLCSGLIYNHANNLKLGNADQVYASKYNQKLAAKTFVIGLVPFVLLGAIYLTLSFTLAESLETVYEAESWADWRDYLQTYVVEEGDYQNVKLDVPAGEYVLNFPEIDAETQYNNDKFYDLGNGFWGITRTSRTYETVYDTDDTTTVSYDYKWILYYSKDGEPTVCENAANPYDGTIHWDEENGFLTYFDKWHGDDVVQVRHVNDSYEEVHWWGKKYVDLWYWNRNEHDFKNGVYYRTMYSYNEEYCYLSLGVGLATIITVSLIYVLKRKKCEYGV